MANLKEIEKFVKEDIRELDDFHQLMHDSKTTIIDTPIHDTFKKEAKKDLKNLLSNSKIVELEHAIKQFRGIKTVEGSPLKQNVTQLSVSERTKEHKMEASKMYLEAIQNTHKLFISIVQNKWVRYSDVQKIIR